MAQPFDLDILRTVFAYHVVEEVVGVDGEVTHDELSFLSVRFPRDRMLELGLFDTTGKPTERFESARGEAIIRLPTELSWEQRVDMVRTFFDAGMADGRLERDESRVVIRAAELLQVPVDDWMRALGSSDDVGELELPEPDGLEGHLVMLDVSAEPTVTPADAATETPSD